MSTPRVACTACERTWHSATMADGLRRIGTCPRCGGELRFADEAPRPASGPRFERAPRTDLPPSQVLGVPRR